MSEKGSRTGTPNKPGSKRGSKVNTPKSGTPKGSKSNTPLPTEIALVQAEDENAAGTSEGTLPPGEGQQGEGEVTGVVADVGDSEVEAEEAAVDQITVYSLIKERVTVQNLKEDMWKEQHEEAVHAFIDDPAVKLMVAYIDPFKGFTIEPAIPTFVVDQLTYLIKSGKVKELTTDNFLTVVQYGTVKGMHIESLLRMMMGIYAPIFFENTTWPDSIKNDFSAQLHKFLANLTDTRWKLEGKTVLYIPTEGLRLASEDAAKNKELVQRLETAMIHWARQIKEVLNNQDAFEMAENSGPLDEIEFWKNRCTDLTGISTQLDKQGVKKITEILQMAKSSYVAPFLKLSSEIKEGSRQAESNLKFLMVLKDPCFELSESKPKDIPAMLPKILGTIRMIWVNSEFYKTRERLTGILKKMSNEIIRRCCKEINLDKIFDGHVQTGMKSLNECIECCESWKEIYNKMSKLHHKFSPVGWVLDKSSIFAQIDAFVQRCKDLIGVCEAQIHFARREEGEKIDMPHFAGQKGPEIARSLLEIEATFEKNLSQLRSVKNTILDVKATSWHDDYVKFRAGIKDLEVMMQNIITSAFDTVNTVEAGVELLDIFMHLASREAIKRTIDKKTVDVYTMFNEELNAVKKELTQKSLKQSPSHPKFAGQGLWARQLKRRIERGMMILDRAHFLPHIGSGEEVRTQYQQLCLALDEYIRKTFHEWTQTVDKEPMKLLEVPLMCRSSEKPPMLDINFNRSLLKIFQEIHYWERLMFEIPHYATDVYNKREDLRALREHVLLVVRDYNRIIAALSVEERGLFKERIRFLDKKIHPGLTKLTWASKGISDFFVTDCRINASKIQVVVDDYKNANMDISKQCVQISDMLLISIDPRKVYKNLEFDEEQANHRENVSRKLKALHDELVRTMRLTYEVFKNDGMEVQQHWHRYTEKMDRMVEEAFRLNIKWSLQELSKAINGDGKSAPNPLFRVKVCLQGDKVEFQPTLKQLANGIGSIGGQLTKAVSGIVRLPNILTKKRSTKDPIHDVISRDEETKKIQTVINTGMQTNATNLQNYLSTWDNYREIWEINKDMFIKRYQKLNPQVSSFDADIARYDEVANNVQTQETILNIQFVLLDCSPLKYAILGHCQEWQNKFTSLLKEIATSRLNELHNFLKDNSTNVSKPPQTLDELGNSLNLWEQLHTGLADTEAKFPPLHDQFGILEKYEVAIPEEVTAMLNDLSNEWVTFQQVLIDAETMLKKHKEKFKSGLLAQSEEFKKQIHNLMDEFATKGPFAANIGTADALSNVAVIKEQLDALKRQEQEIRKGLNIFKIDQPPSKEVANLDKDLELIETIWNLNKDWEGLWSDWKGNKFTELQTADMENNSQAIYKKLNRFSKELKDKNWEVVDTSRNKVDQFKRTMPLINDLKNKAMRPRHWTQIQKDMAKEFDHNSEDFTLEKIIEYGFDQFAEQIGDISGAATKELAIEQGIAGIESTWNVTELDIGPYKDRGHFKLKSTDDVFLALEDNQVQLSTMKASRFVKAFEQEVDRWERVLSHILEVVEMLLQVQRQWMYLENIFLGEDIRKQLPRESAEFDDVNGKWKLIMSRLNKDRNALRGTHHEGLLESLNDMNVKLEEIQKSLDMYLETKRQIFPRFYFLSNDDLLEILGQSKNPKAVQPHLKKCFDNIKSLEMIKPSLKWEASGMWSTEGEFVEYEKHVYLEGLVEAWLCDVEKTMRWTLKDELKKCRVSLKKHMTKRDKWIKEHPGQLCITASQMQWTTDVERALKLTRDRGDKKALKTMKRKQVAMLNKFSEAIRGNLSKMQRMKVVALVTIEVHARDIIEKLIKTNTSDENAFEWLSQLRLYWEKSPIDDCVVKQTNTQFPYGYEYLGNSGRLVITPLTDRCYITLTTALHLHRGGSPKGPAGTGKTETVKDLGKCLGMYVIVVNCSEGLDYKSMGRMFSGLAQTGAWGCFDEFNRINIEVLSVVAQQILSILSALAAGSSRFVFEGREIDLVWSCGIFITMNPGYAGRTELPDNLKSMFRPIAMVTPDSNLIAEITLFGEGFGNTKALAKKVYTLYSLAEQQLSKQDHYDFGLRALVSVLRYAGRKKRSNPNMPDEELLLLSMKDMNVAKMTAVDLPLFNGIMSDLFPGIETPTIDYSKMKNAVIAELKENQLQCNNHTITKILQLYETKTSRHSVMIVGSTQAGKTVAWRILQGTMSRLNKEKDSGFQVVKEYPINPKSLSLGELYGEFDLNTNEWTDGVLSSVMRQTCADERPDEKWLVFDGPVDTLWIESMNSVMDDNKILTLINGERISMPEQVSLLFEVEDLAVASPATVSRCGMVYADYNDNGWEPFVESWLEKKKDQKQLVEELRRLFDKYLVKILEFKRQNCHDLIPIAQLNGVSSLCKLFDSLGTQENGVDPHDAENFVRMVELWFQFCMIWSICCSVDEEGRKKIDNYIREMESTFPNKDTIYEYCVDPKGKTWVHWEEKLRGGFKFAPGTPFYKLIVPTVDTVRYQYLVSALIRSFNPVMLVGPVGTGKTSVIENTLSKVDPKVYSLLTVNMSAQTSSNQVQDIIESRVEKRTKGVYVPIGGKKLLTFMDDFNMPGKDTFGSQPPLELMKLWLDYGFWYDRLKQTIKSIKDMFLLAAMGPPGGGRMVISRRLQSRFNLINMTFPQESQIKRIFGSMINQKLQDFEEEVKPIGDVLTQATIEMYQAVVSKFLPTPTKIHYLFNLRDISKIFQGLLRAHKDYHDTKSNMTRLWIHECFRVFSDRLVEEKDHETFINILTEKLGTLFDQTYHNICPNKQPPIFGDYMNIDCVYEDIHDIGNLKKHMMDMLEEYNTTPGVVNMDLVLFRDAIEHVSKVVRVIRQPRGNMLLVGVGGSGRQSLTRLAASICEFKIFQIEVTKQYRKQEFRDDLKRLYWQAGVDNKPTVFIFNDTQVVEEGFLEDINNILSSGEVPNLYKPDEFEEVRTALSDIVKKEGIDDSPQSVFAFLVSRVRANLHVVLCMSPVGEPFRNRMRMYPAFVNCTTIDWFSEWPQDALLEVADKYLAEINLGGEDEKSKKQAKSRSSFKGGNKVEKLKPLLAKMFSVMHKSVVAFSLRLLLEMRRHNYVTPTNYLELVSGYKKLLFNKNKELGDACNKLKNGLSKIDETREKVEKMSIELEDAKIKVAQFQKQCDDYLVTLVQQKREADEQQKSVAQKSERITEEESKCQHMADLAQHDLDEALPALEESIKALESLNKKDIGEIKSYGRPPTLVEKVMEAVMILRGQEPSWGESKRQLGDNNFIKQLMNFDKDNISDRVLKKIGGYVAQSDFQPEIIGRVSGAAKSLCMWVRAMEVYGRVFRVVEPKKQRLNAAMNQLKEKQDALADAKAKLAEVEAKMAELKQQYDEKLAQKEELKRKAEYTEMMLDRAAKLVSGLAGERIRWEETVKDLEERMGYLVGDCLMAAAFMSYMGPFLSNYRDEMVQKIWLVEIRKLAIPCAPDFSFCNFMAKPTDVRDWNIKGLPNDNFSSENGVIVTSASRWPLMVDPQGQAIKWIKNMEAEHGLKVIDLQQSDYMRTLEASIQFGLPVLLQNVQESLDPSLDPILNKSLMRVGGAYLIKLGDKEIEYNPDFRFYITTKLSNPHYTPEISTKTTITNFAVKEQGLEAQLLGIVVRKERPDLEEQKDSLVRSIAAGKKKIVELEDEILRLLNETKGSLLDDEQLVNTLQTSKITSQEVSEQLQISELTEVKIDAAREGYRPSAERASILFFVLNDMGRIDPMYQFSLDAYIELFIISIDKSPRSSKLEERITNLNEYHTYAVYRYTCRGLFERHKLLFSFQMCAKILESANKINMDEYNFFLRGGVVLDRENQMDNPCSGWLSDIAWDNITELDKQTNFHGVITSFEQYPRDWNIWYTSAEPETATLPGEWDNACNELQRMLIVRSLRSDRVSFCATSFIINNLGSKFTEPPVLDMQQVVEDSTTRTPLIFVLSAGVDPTSSLLQLAESSGMAQRFHALSLGQGQAPIATRMIKEGVREGNWVFLANCHLSLSWMPQLDKLVEQLQIEQPHPEFRLWLSSSPHPEFPISILQTGIKMTTEPPKGLKANMKRLLNLVTEQQFARCTKQEKYRKLLFALCYFHSILLERRKFLMLGWNIAYEFNDADFEVSENLLSIYLDGYDDTPWDALKYLIANINYGGHVTDDCDRRLLMTYVSDYFHDSVLSTPFYKMSILPTYYVPKDGPLSSYKEYVSMLPNVDHPEAFGQHPNADIASQITETRLMFDTLLSLQPTISAVAGESREDKVLDLAANIYKQIPENIDYENTAKILSIDPSPLNVVLLQEIQRYNILLDEIRSSLTDLERGIQGLVVMTLELENIFTCIFDGRVPPSWLKAYSSLKPLAAWTRDLVQRVDQFQHWALTAHAPTIFWMSAFTFPTGFLTAVLQTSARQNSVSVDTLQWEFSVLTVDDTNITGPPKDGVYIKGLYLQGAGWDKKNTCLVEANPMQLVCPMPSIHFRAVESKKKAAKGLYSCPCYYYPNRVGVTGRPSYIVSVDLKTGEKAADHWVKRGTALLMSLDY
ncbi:dynein heavy chain 2, axonemal-like isoform X4 [Mizuhopecten yessoensis]|uniref:dynein heavy chain 2, axonemal-like isoform X4 n=1 Tax=Mizuhopecten yessoensis TaxID=6573 RepID=UPI000B45E129|nr:dynein heavy chain 2, axonemal-like isoform X4 [Mizuhopecten yessoensis]